MAYRIDNIGYDLHSNNDFETDADYYYTNQPTYHAQLKIPGYQYNYYLDLATKIQATQYAANQNPDGTTKSSTDPTFVTTPSVADVARLLHDFYYPIYMNPPSTAAAPVSGTAPGLV